MKILPCLLEYYLWQILIDVQPSIIVDVGTRVIDYCGLSYSYPFQQNYHYHYYNLSLSLSLILSVYTLDVIVIN